MEADDGGMVFESQVDLREPVEGTNMARELIGAFRRHSGRVIMVDARSGRAWTGAAILDRCARVATCLARQAGLKVNDVVMTICDRNDSELIAALGIVLSGAALYPTTPSDGFSEVATLCELVRPNALMISPQHHQLALQLCREVVGMSDTKIIWIEGLSAAPTEQQNSLDSTTNGPDSNGTDQNNNTGTTQSGPASSARENDKTGAGESESRPASWPQDDAPAIIISLDRIELTQPLDMQLVESIANERIDNKQHMVQYLLTSGSTGRPKVVPSSHLENLYQVYTMISAAINPFKAGRVDSKEHSMRDENNNVESPSRLLPVGPDDVCAGDLPLDHGAGLGFMYLALWLGAKYVVMPSFDAQTFWQTVNDYKISFSLSSTTFCFQLFSYLKHHLASSDRSSLNKLDLSSLRTVTTCGAKLTCGELVDEIRNYLPSLSVSQSYGCTECGYISGSPDELESVGYLFPGNKAKIVDPNTRRLCKRNEPGELYIWSKALFQGYCCHPEVDADEIFRNCHDERGEYYRTGDQVHMDEQDRLYVHGRYKDTLVLMGDWKVMPAELEEVVNKHPLVETSAVVGVPDPELPSCHKPKAFVKLIQEDIAEAKLSADNGELLARLRSKDCDYIAKDIYQFTAERLAPAKHLKGGVRILDEFPQVGLLKKIDRKVLRTMD